MKIPDLNTDIYYTIGGFTSCQTTLSHLCRVSRHFNTIFTSILYQRIQLQDCESAITANLAELSTETHLQYTKALTLGPNIGRTEHKESFSYSFGPKQKAIAQCLNKMPNLTTLW